jgi:predicted site-specific integrase-resolvase
MARRKSQDWLSVQDILDDLGVPRRTWQRWRALGRVPKCKRLPNGELRIHRADYERWINSLEDVA